MLSDINVTPMIWYNIWIWYIIIMDQVLFVFDMEEVVPLGELDDGLLEARLNSVKQAALRILASCTDDGELSESRRDLPSLGFR